MVTSLVGAKYFLTFIDDYSQFLWVYTIKSKDEVFANFRNLKLLPKLNVIRRSSVLGLMEEVNILVMLSNSFSAFTTSLGCGLFPILSSKKV
jgi:hypothetical protein